MTYKEVCISVFSDICVITKSSRRLKYYMYHFKGELFMLKKWDELPEFMKCDEVKEYYEILEHRRLSLFFKRVFDIITGIILLLVLIIPMAAIAVMVKLDSKGPVFYRQERITVYGKKFRIHKFRTMIDNADKKGFLITAYGDSRITEVGAKLRRYRLDELPQIIDVIQGNMSLVGTRPETVRYVEKYSKEMRATLLLPAGITSEASIRYKDEAELLDETKDVDKVYVEEVLPEKMKYNLESIRKFSILRDAVTIVKTVAVVAGKK